MNTETKEFVDVFEVPRGKNCGCICPSCSTPLIARQGTEKQWHFAHASRTVYEDTKKECEFSFFVSVRLMARQIIESSLEIHLPKYVGKVSKILDNHSIVSIPFNVTPKQLVTITEVSVEENFENVPVDITGKIGTHSFVIYFTHPERAIPLELKEPTNKMCGIVEVSLDKTHTLFNSSNAPGRESYKEILLSFLKNDLSSKKWIFHPRYEISKNAAEQELLKRVKTENEKIARMFVSNKQAVSPNIFEAIQQDDHSESYYAPPQEFSEYEEPERKPAKYECLMCHSQWEGIEPGKNLCPKCKTHLYSKFVAYA